LVYEVVDNCIDEAMAGQCDRILVVLEKNDVVRVEDNGRGIPSEILENLGKKGATFGKEGGSGLGIYGAKKYIEKMGGKLEIKSRLGDGTMVMIILPRSV
jgi:signal transduction histidine kinase